MLARLAANPIYRAERALLTRQRSALLGWRRGWRWFARLVYLVVLVQALVIAGVGGAAIVMHINPRPVFSAFAGFPIMMTCVSILLQLSLMFRAGASAAASIARDRQSGGWDLLLMTGVASRRIVWGKFAAVVERYLPATLLVLPLRLGVILYYSAMVIGRTYTLRIVTPATVVAAILALVALVVVLWALTALSIVFAAGIGMGVSPWTRRIGVAVGAGALALIVVAGVTAALFGVPAWIFALGVAGAGYGQLFEFILGFMIGMAFLMLENGTFILTTVFGYLLGEAWEFDAATAGFGVSLLGYAALVALFAWAGLRVAVRGVRRQGGL